MQFMVWCVRCDVCGTASSIGKNVLGVASTVREVSPMGTLGGLGSWAAVLDWVILDWLTMVRSKVKGNI